MMKVASQRFRTRVGFRPILSESVVFNMGEIAPQGTISCVVGSILWFTIFGGRFWFPGGRFLQVETYSNVKLIPKNQYLLLWNQTL